MQKKHLFITLLALTTVAAGGTTLVHASTSSLSGLTGTVTFVPGTSVTPPVNPDQPDPNNPVTPENPDGSTPEAGTAGPLSIDFSSTFDFGTHPISNKDETYDAKAQFYSSSTMVTPDYVQVTDDRGTDAGWQLKVTQSNQFTEVGNGANPVLTGAVISLNDPIASSNGNAAAPTEGKLSLVPGQASVVATATVDEGAGTWTIRWGNDSDLTQDSTNGTEDPDVQLFVPGSTVKDAAKYTTTLDWELSVLPQN